MITSLDNQRVKEVLRLRRSRERRRAGLFVAEGPREVSRALAAGLVARSIYIAPDLLVPDLRAPDLLAPDLRASDLLTQSWPHTHEEVSAKVLAKMAYRAEPEGVLAVFEIPQRAIPHDSTLILVAVGIEKPGNLGAMARSADAAGADALLVADAEADPWNPNAIRASTGAVFTLPVLEVTRAEVAELPQTTVAAVVGAPLAHHATDLTQPVVLLIGAEDTGLDATWQELADVAVSIPMRNTATDSLNAGTAAAVLLFEARRQRDTTIR